MEENTGSKNLPILYITIVVVIIILLILYVNKYHSGSNMDFSMIEDILKNELSAV